MPAIVVTPLLLAGAGAAGRVRLDAAFVGFAFAGFAFADFAASGGGPAAAGLCGVSRTTSRADLSARNPMKVGWRSTPSSVHSVKPISATSLGSTQWTSRTAALFGMAATGLVLR